MSYIGNSPGVASQRVETAFTATASQTVFTPSSGYTLGYCDVYYNGVKLVNGDDYTAADGVSITLATAAAAGDSVVVVASFPRGLSDGYLKAEADAKYVALTGDQTIAGVKTFSGSATIVNGNLGVGTSSVLGNSTFNAALGIAVRNQSTSMGYFQTYNANAGSNLKTWRWGGTNAGNLVFETVNDAYSSATTRFTLNSVGGAILGALASTGVETALNAGNIRVNNWGNNGLSSPAWEHYVYDNQATSGGKEVAYDAAKLSIATDIGERIFATKSGSTWKTTLTLRDGLATFPIGRVVVQNTAQETYGYSGGTGGTINLNNKNYIGGVHLNPYAQSGSSNINYGAAITFGARDSQNWAQAGLFVVSDGSYGTKMALGTTDDYDAGAKTALHIDHAGRVTKPKQPFILCKVTSASGTSVGTMALTSKSQVNMSVGSYASSNALIAPVTGVYSITLNMLTATDAGRRDISIYKNGTVILSSLNDSNGDGYHHRTIAANLYLASGDAIQVVQSNGGAYYASSTYTTSDLEWANISFALIA